MQQVYSKSDAIRMQQVYSESENQIQLECSSRSVRNQRIRYNQNAAGLLRIRESDTIRVQQVHSEWRYKYSCHCKALRAHLEMRCSTDVRTTRQADKRNKGSIIEDQQEVSFGLFYFFFFVPLLFAKKWRVCKSHGWHQCCCHSGPVCSFLTSNWWVRETRAHVHDQQTAPFIMFIFWTATPLKKTCMHGTQIGLFGYPERIQS